MSGHSKWSTIKRKKEKTDAGRAKIFTKIGREMMVCVREGGADPLNNAKLRDLIAKAKANNVPNDNIDRLIKKAAGGDDKSNYEVCIYEGYGPCGTAFIVECLTDNRNRTASEMRHYFDKFGGNLGTIGCVSFMFSKKGIIIIDEFKDEDKLVEDCIESGADDVEFNESAEIICDPNQVWNVQELLKAKGYDIISAEAVSVPDNYVHIDGEDNLIKFNRLIDALDDNDDVQNVFHNWDGEE